MKLFYGLFLGLTAAQAAILYVVIPGLGTPGNVNQLFWLQFGLFALVTLMTVALGFRAMQAGSFSRFQAIFFLSIFAKLVLAGTIVYLAKSRFPDGGLGMALPIAIAYMPYLGLELYCLVFFSRKLTEEAK